MITVNPSASFEAVAQFETGLTLGIRITDNAGATTLARTTSGITEYPAGSGIYAVTLTSPGSAGQYSLVWDDGTNYATDDLLVTSDTVSLTTIGTGNLYVTSADLKTILGIDDASDYADTAIDLAVETASRIIDAYKRCRYYPTTEIRYYTNDFSRARALAIDDLVSLTSVQVDTDGDLVYDETWVNGTDFVLDPVNAPLEGKPYDRITLIPNARQRIPTGPHAVKVAGSFGWAETPTPVQQAAVLLANRFVTRSRQAPLGVLVAQANDAIALARLGSIDPDAAFLLDQLPGRRPGLTSTSLG